ncbi:hypothetical protein CRU92_06300 [Arcobacter sp. FW59]|nr:hypothetical protein CRU92_06300 [Arcobacter sp. FW59]
MHNRKSIILVSLGIVFLILLSIYYLIKNNDSEDIKVEIVEENAPVIVIEQVNKINKNDITIKPIKKLELMEEKGKILFSSSDESGRYTVQLLNAVDIEVPKRISTRYIPIMGEIEDNNIVSEFTISISENYLNYLSDLKFKIVDNENIERDIETYTYFLGALDLNSIYTISLKISGDTLDGKIKSSSKFPEFVLKGLQNSSQPILINEDDYIKIPSSSDKNNINN